MARPGRRLAALGAALVLAMACGTPVGVKRMDPVAVQRELTRSVLTSDSLSATTQNVLFQHDLVDRWADDPKGTIAALHETVAKGDARRNDVFALTELSYAYAERENDRSYYRSAAVYAWLFFFPSDDDTPLRALDPRVRVAADLYNRSVAQGFLTGSEQDFVPRDGSYPVPFGRLDVDFDQKELVRGTRRMTRFVPVADLEVEGLPTRYRWSGVGAPLAASTEPIDPAKGYSDYVQPWAKVAVTALLRMHDVEPQLATGRVRARLTLEEPIVNSDVEIEGRRVPLETETSASLAYMLAESPVWQREIGGFLQRMAAIEKGTELASLVPYQRGRIPVVFVHGTASSPGRWAAMINELANDRRIGARIQPWLFTYDTGNPIVYSAMLLRESLKDLVARLDPEGTDPALRDMVVIGHSQGGLLTKMAAIDSGDRIWRLASDRPFSEIELDPENLETVRKMAFIEPVPQVKRVLFLSTPHHGSYVAGNWLAHQAARLINFPASVTRVGTDLLARNRARLNARFSGLGTSVVGMTPGQPFITELAEIPIVPSVKAHSVIAVTDPDAPRDEADDGVVEYTSAHIEGVESEYVVVSGHSCQDNPNAIQEVRRILLEHIAEFDAARQVAKPKEATAPTTADRAHDAEPATSAEPVR